MILALIAFIAVMNFAGTFGLILPTPTPLFFRLKSDVGAALELAGLGLLDRVVDADVDPLDRAREDVLRERELVDVDADAPHAGLSGRVQDAEAAAAGDLELDLRALADLVLRDRLALVLGR